VTFSPIAVACLEFSGKGPIIKAMTTASTILTTGAIRRIIDPAS
jgi:hypothetical protein